MNPPAIDTDRDRCPPPSSCWLAWETVITRRNAVMLGLVRKELINAWAARAASRTTATLLRGMARRSSRWRKRAKLATPDIRYTPDGWVDLNATYTTGTPRSTALAEASRKLTETATERPPACITCGGARAIELPELLPCPECEPAGHLAERVLCRLPVDGDAIRAARKVVGR